MRALTWQGRGHVSVETVPDPTIEQPNDAIIKVTSTAICGSDLHLYEVLGPFLNPGDVLGHETMGIVEEVGSEVSDLRSGRPGRRAVQHLLRVLLDVLARPVRPVRDHAGARAGQGRVAVRLHRRCTARCRAARPSTCACRRPSSGRSRCPRACPDERYLYLSDILPTAWQAVAYADVPTGGTLAVFGLGPVGQLATRIALAAGLPGHRRRPGARAAGPGRRSTASRSLDLDEVDDVAEALLAMTDGRGAGRHRRRGRHGGARLARAPRRPSAVVGSAARRAGQTADRQARRSTDWPPCIAAIKSVRRGGTVSVSGVYGGEVDPMPMMEMFDRGITMRMGQCHVRRWIDDILPRCSTSRGRARRRVAGHPPAAAREAPDGVRDVPEEAGRLHQGGAPPVNGAAPVLIVTGASSGIGRAVALRAARTGAHLVLVARDGAALAEVAEECESLGAAGALRRARRRRRRRGRGRRRPPDLGARGQARRRGQLGGGRGLRALQAVPVDVFDGVLRTNLLGCGQRGPPRPAGPAGPGPRPPGAGRLGARSHRRRRG